ncbi:MAG: SLBB domain-containing protein [Deltaproteobacteria bacterium]|nr:SLBB domain-containing protein [Deltaproteobacteria bacterium]
MKYLYRVLSVLIIVQFVVYPVYSYGDDNQGLNKQQNMQTSSGMSFRVGETGSANRLGSSILNEQDYAVKGMMMTEPTMSGLTYQVHVLGEVKNPGTYRITASDRLSEILMRAGGVDEQGSERNIEVRRKGEYEQKIDLLSFQLFGNLKDNPYLLDNDIVYVPLKKGVIKVVGAVMRPREYELNVEQNLNEVIKLAGGFSVGAAKGSPIRAVRFIDGKKSVLDISDNEADMMAFNVQNGDVIFVPHMITEKNNFDYNIPKLPGDNIFYPSYEDRVFILGGVASPGAYPFNPYYNLSQYLSLAGGTTKMATGKMSLVSADGKKKRLHKRDMNNITINPGDTIDVDWRRIPPESWIGIFSGLSTLALTSLALSRTW